MSSKYYDNLVNFLNDNNCKMKTTLDEFLNIKEKFKKISIISSCGHESHNIYCNVLKNRNTGIICKKCTIDKFKNNNKNNSSFNTLKYEYESFKILFDNLKNITIKKTDEGCKADLIIKPYNISDDKWLPIQVKSTTIITNNFYSFGFTKNKYDGNIIILIYIPNNQIWILDSDIVKNNSKISIGSKKSKYDIYKVNINELDNKLLDFYKNYKKYHKSFNTINLPIAINQQKEQLHRLNRENKLPFLKFDYPEQNQMVYDFKINNFKIQEKVASRRINRKAYTVSISKNSGNNKLSCYDINDNDFYWINIPNFNFFILIPENILIQKNIVGRVDKKKKNIYISKTIYKDNWLYQYVFSYKKPNKNYLLSLFYNITN